MKPVRMALIGAGNRGMDAYGPFALEYPDIFKFTAVAEPDRQKRHEFAKKHQINPELRFENWEDMLRRQDLADAVLICTQDRYHYDPAIKALDMGYSVLLEKPMATTLKECVSIVEHSKKSRGILSVCHVLRFTPFFTKIKELVDTRSIGRLISIQHNENVGFLHQAHSFVRGNWRNSQTSSPMILAKSCHDMDIMYWLAGAKPVGISSFGKLTHFKPQNAPEGAPDRCLDGCPIQDECNYYAPGIYTTDDTGWPTSVISTDKSLEARRRALVEGPYGRCVYKCDNNVVDHQVVSIEFENEVTAAFTMCAFTNETTRTIKLMGTEGEIRGHMEKNRIEIIRFSDFQTEVITPDKPVSGHGGGDFGLMHNFADLVLNREKEGLTSAEASLTSHLMSFAAERSRLQGKVLDPFKLQN